jgi:hypothetical protein
VTIDKIWVEWVGRGACLRRKLTVHMTNGTRHSPGAGAFGEEDLGEETYVLMAAASRRCRLVDLLEVRVGEGLRGFRNPRWTVYPGRPGLGRGVPHPHVSVEGPRWDGSPTPAALRGDEPLSVRGVPVYVEAWS